MAQFRRSIQPTGFRPEQVSDKNISQLQAYSDRITNSLREERDAVISNRNRTADALKENARIQEQQLGRDADIQDRNIQNQIREQDLLAQKARQDFDTNTRASREMFGTIADLSVTASLKLQEIEVERFKDQAVSDYAEVMMLGDNSPKVKATEALAKDHQAEQVKAYTEIATAQANGAPPVVADRMSKNINELSFGAKVARLHQLQKQYSTFLNTKFMDPTAQYTDETGKTFTGQQAARDGKRTGIVASAALKEFMDVNGITGMNAGFLQKSGFLPGILGINQSAMNSAEKAEREDYLATFTADLEYQLSNTATATDGTAIIQTNWPELVRLYGFQGALDVLQKIYSTTDSKGQPVNDLAGLAGAKIGPNGQTFGEYWAKNRMPTIQKTLSQAKNAAFQEEQQTNKVNATKAALELLPGIKAQLAAADAQDDQSIIATIKAQFSDNFNGFIPAEIINLERQNLEQNTRESQEQAALVLEKIRTGQATQGDVLSIADDELRAKVQEQYAQKVYNDNYGTNYKENLKKAEAAAKQIMGDSLEGSGGLEAMNLADVIKKNFAEDYREGLTLYKDPDRAEQHALAKMQKDKDAALLNQDKNARYYSIPGPNNQKEFKNVRAFQARTAAQQNADLDKVRQTLASAGLNALNSPGFLGTESELRRISEANLTGQVLKFTPQIKEAAKILGRSELELTNEAINAYNQYNTVKIPPLKLDPTLRAVNNARPATRALFTNNPTVQTILRGAAEIQQTSLRDPNYLRSSFRGDAPGIQGVLSMIRSGEGSYTSMFPSESYPQLTNMSISEVVNFQKQKLRDGRASAAVGAYQFLNPERAAQLAGLSLNDKFTPTNQDKMAVAYMIEGTKRPKLAAYLSGKSNDLNAAHLDIAQEWAALAGPSGKGAYDNDGKNKASISAERVRAALKEARKQLSGK